MDVALWTLYRNWGGTSGGKILKNSFPKPNHFEPKTGLSFSDGKIQTHGGCFETILEKSDLNDKK